MQNVVNKYFTQWLSDLISLLPESWSIGISGNDEKIVICIQDKQTADVYLCRHNDHDLVGNFVIQDYLQNEAFENISKSMVSVLLPESMFLRQQVALPRKADKNLREVLSYEISRQTPFNENDVYFDFVIDRKSTVGSTLKAELIVTPREDIDTLWNAIEQAGATVDSISINQDVDEELCLSPTVNFLPDEKRPVKPKLWTWYNKVTSILLLILLTFAIALPFNVQSKAMKKLQADIALFETKASSARKLRDDIALQASELSKVIEKKNQYPAMIQILDELSTILPDDTWLQRMEYDNARIEIQGESGAASDLIGLLEKSELLTNTRFLSQVIQNPRSGAERFQIQSVLVEKKNYDSNQ